MPAMVLAQDAYQRDYGNLPELKLVNFFMEPSPTSQGGFALQARKGLTSSAQWGTGPVHGIYSQPGLFGGDRFAVVGTSLYRDGTLLGVIGGSGPVSWASSHDELVVARGASAYSYNGTNLAAIAFPDAQDVVAVAYLASRFLFAAEDTDQVYFSALLDARTISGADFFSAEMGSDSVADLKTVQGALFLLGEGTIEQWVPSGSAALPFIRTDLRFYTTGVIDTGCAVVMNDTLLIIGNDAKVYALGEGLQPVSHHGIEERITQSATWSAYGYFYEGKSNFCVRLDTGTEVLDLNTGKWWTAATYQRDNWRPKCATNVGSIPYFGDDETNDIWEFDDVFQDDGADLEGYFSAYVPAPAGQLRIDSVEVMANVGRTVPLSGDDASPAIEMRASRDGGATFGSWRQAPLGGQGEYRTRPVIRRWGSFDPPGALFELRITDRSPRRISAVNYNEPAGGRSR